MAEFVRWPRLSWVPGYLAGSDVPMDYEGRVLQIQWGRFVIEMAFGRAF